MAPELIAPIASAPASYRPLPPPPKPPVPTPQDYVTSFLRFKEQIWAEICEENDLDPSTSNPVDFPDLWQDAFRTALEDADWYEQSHIFLKVSWRNYCTEWTPDMWEQVAQECEIQGLVKWQLPIAQTKLDCQVTCLILQELLALAKHAAFDVGRDSGEWAEDTGDGMNWEYSRIRGYIVAGAARQDWVLAKRLLETHVWGVTPLFKSGKDDYGIDIDFDDDEEMPMVAHGAQAFCADVLTAVLCSNASDEDVVELISRLLPEDCSDWECSSMSDTAFLAVSQACQAMLWSFDDDDRKDQAEEIGEFAWLVTVKAALPYAAQDPYLDLSEEFGWVGWVCDCLKKVCSDLCLGWQPEDKLLYWKAALNEQMNAGDYAIVGKWVAQETGARAQRQQGSKRRGYAYDLELYHGCIVLNEEEFTGECKPKPRIPSLQTLAGKKNPVIAGNCSQGHITDKCFKALLNLQTAPLLQTLYITDQRIGYDMVMKVIKVRKKGGLKVQAGETGGDSMAASMVRSEMGMGWGDGIYGNVGGDDFDDYY